MRTCRISLLVVVLAVIAGTAHATDERLLVVVESTPGAGVDAREVRQTVGAELGIPVVAPEDATAAGASNVLIVAVDKSDIRMSLRGSAVGLVGRTIPAPSDRPTRLREIGWLAGNLARDQVSGIVAVPAERPDGSKLPLVAQLDPSPPTEPLPPPTTPVAVTQTTSSSEPAATVATSATEVVRPGPQWAITATRGPTANTYGLKGEMPLIGNDSYQIEVQRESSPGGVILGCALDVGPVSSAFGIAAFVGSSWRSKRWFLEATAGVGIELVQVPETTYANSPLTGTSSMTTLTRSELPYARGIGEIGYSINGSFDLVARIGVSLANLSANGGNWDSDFVSTGLGLRFRLP
jgi:hypothetical protein